MERRETILAEVRKLYESDKTPSMGRWMWDNHVQWVADKARMLAEKYGANAEKSYCAALLHDLADSRYSRSEQNFAIWSNEKSVAILRNAGFSKDETLDVLEAIRTHSCHPGNLPTTLEGKVLATADAMFHLQTSLYPMLCYMHRPEHTQSYEDWQDWFLEKIERDFSIKIFFDDEKTKVTEDYEALSKVFGNVTLHAGIK